MTKLLKNKKAIIILIIIIGGFAAFWYFRSKNTTAETKYILSQVKRDNLFVSVSSSGMISPVDEINLNAKASGEIVYLNMEDNQAVQKGDLLLKIKTTDQEKIIRDLELDIESAKISLAKARQGAQVDENTLKNQTIGYLVQAVNDWKNYLNNFESALKVDISDYRLNFDYLYEYYASIVNFYFPEDINYQQVLKNSYSRLDQNYQDKSILVSHLNSNSSLDEVERVLNLVLEEVKILNDSSRAAYQLLNRYQIVLNDYNLTPLVSERNIITDKAAFSTLSTAINTDLTNLLTASKNITNYKEGAENNLPYDIRQLEINLQKKEDDLKDAKDKLNDYYLYAPFDGIISSLNVKKGDSVSSQTTVAKLITAQTIAEASFNEVDVVKIKVGQRAEVTFDALPDLVLAGKVIEVDSVGTESMGVVSYKVKVALDENNENIKPSMSANIEVFTEEKDNVLVVPSSAIKTANGKKYVEVVKDANLEESAFRSGIILTTPPERRFIEVGISSDTLTEIKSGLAEGEIIVLSVIKPNSSSNNSSFQGSSLFNNVGGSFGGGMPSMGGARPSSR